ncbi:MAG: GDP-mannose dehydrogenase [Candidatus Bathyarchaeota archaeon]|nr:GDP-mannose dehydrogenase [Candidatus Bathyarchaeota archaeon]
MRKQKVLVVGLGEVGRALYELLEESGKVDVYGFDLSEDKMRDVAGKVKLPSAFDIMHICYPCVDVENFVTATLDYMRKFNPQLTIIDSTVPPGTTQRICNRTKSLVVHSPIRGMHKNLETMKRDIMFWSKYVGGATREAAELARKHFEQIGLKVKVLSSPVETELAKLFETTYRAWMIACFQEMHRISRHFGANFDEVVDMIEDIHRVHFNKPLHYPGVIGGHCLIPNTKLLLKVWDSEFLHLILKSNDKRKEEIKDKNVYEEVEQIRRRAEVLQKDLMNLLENSQSQHT